MVPIDDAEILRTKPESAVLCSDDGKTVADTPSFIDGFSLLVRICTGVRISDQPVEVIKVCALNLISQQRHVYVKKELVDARKVKVEDGVFPVEKDWFLVGRSLVTATSTSKGRKLEDNEVVDFKFPTTINCKVPGIIRFSTKRCGEIGRLPMDWSNWAVFLLRSGKVKMLGRCVAAPKFLQMMQDIMLYVSSIFIDVSKSTWHIGCFPNIDSTLHPLLQLFKHLTIKPYQKACGVLSSRTRLSQTVAEFGDDIDERAALLAVAKRRKGCEHYIEQSKDEENRVVDAADSYNLEMSESEKGIDVDKAAETLDPCWEVYRICDEYWQMHWTWKNCDDILARPGRGNPENEEDFAPAADVTADKPKRKESHHRAPTIMKAKGGTLIVCPMTLLSQWKMI
ncbi:unnamed protein product [Microthlaspi erraticum]|uniref:HIRAN domain-containing protein n=1 Tax=Microthlaspi erraticum TaxID=1685480 RepID=A0A6D2IUP1_9BRAS|nr:unnamed protein product [Microthlaspi erraticum]